MDRIIARVKSIYIMFHNIIYIVTFHVIYETVSINIHNFAFIAKQRCHVLMVKIIQTCFRYIEDAHTYVYQFAKFHLEFAHFYCNQILRKEYENSVSRSLPLHRISHSNPLFNPSYLPFQRIKSRTSTWLRTFSMVFSKTALSLICINFSRTHCSREF